jgi:phosphoenolpyruvate synthase/pyruvate phosphate dikinase
MSDFKSNEYANLIGGKYFEPHEENPMIGFRGASVTSDFYRKVCPRMRSDEKSETKWGFST